MAAVRLRKEPVAGARDDFEPVALQLQFADHLRVQETDDVRARGVAKPWRELLGDRRTADDVARLEDPYPQARPGEVGRTGEAVVAGADDDGVATIAREGDLSSPAMTGPAVAA
jgi:hypothetical protein